MKKSISFWQVLIEFISVVFAVLLALGLNSYKQNKDLQDEARLLSNKIIRECERNMLELDTALRQNMEFKLYVDSLRAAEEMPNSFDISISSELMTRSAWDFTKASRSFSYLDESFLEEAAALYERQDYYMHISNQLFQSLGNMIMSDPEPENSLSVANYLIMNLNASAQNLQTNYQQFLKKYKSDSIPN